ncbi:carboxymuconolactone decarboxylase family protein [Caballeronia sp. GAWG2-1]|uniref:carboxymuconolactone decarboxylase family protein n=1 Tax=Caballeronia sp. GAWG2-1 TaxID=2921744 RepID=UPI002027B3D5|nr:carboxymuconolactone decarboxylase family protein [Caballeronia sp. GAWG2-1]
MSSDSIPAAQLSTLQTAIIPIAAFAACGQIDHLNGALEDGLDAGLSVNAIKELLVQVYAYAGFPRSLNALGAFMKVVDTRRERGIEDTVGPLPSQPAPVGDALLDAGTRIQTELVGSPVKGPLFDFAPAIGQFLKTHLFGDIFLRDNFDWQAREIATISMLSALEGVGSQLQSHLGVSMNVGLTEAQLRECIAILARRVNQTMSDRAEEALTCLLDSKKNKA